MLYISLSTGRSATRFWRKCIYANAVMLISRLRSFSPAPGGPGAYVLFLGFSKLRRMCPSEYSTESRLQLYRTNCSFEEARAGYSAIAIHLFLSSNEIWPLHLCCRGPRVAENFYRS